MFTLPHFQFFKWKAISNVSSIVYDAYFNYTSLLINAESVSTGSQNSTFIDSSTNNFSITAVNSPTQTSLTPYSPRDWGVVFDGNSRLTVAAGNDFAYGLSAFTIEAWINPSSFASSPIIFSQTVAGTNYFMFLVGSDGKLYFNGNASGTSNTVAANSGLIVANQWQHVTLVREGSGANQLKFYINGILAGSSSTSVNFTNTSYAPSIGAYTHTFATNAFFGHISNLRVVKGQALYTGNFTPPVSALSRTSIGTTGSNVAPSLTGTVSLLTCQSNRFVDNSLSARAITVTGTPKAVNFNPFSAYRNASNSVYFNGSSMLSAINTSIQPLSTNNFTAELWFYPASLNGTQTYFTNAVTVNMDGLYIGSDAGEIQVLFGNTSAWTSVVASGTAPPTTSFSSIGSLNAWNHIAVVRNSATSASVYINGKLYKTTSISSNTTLTNSKSAFSIGGRPVANQYHTGYISNVRVVHGQALYTGNFTPASAALTNNAVGTSGANVVASLTGTVAILACQDPVVTTENSTSPKTITPAGTPYATTNTPFLTATEYVPVVYSPSTHNGSVYFNGSNNYLRIAENASNILSAGTPFTVEAWLYPTGDYSKYRGIVSKRNASNIVYEMYTLVTTGYLAFHNGTSAYTSSVALNLNAWNHVSWVYNGTQLSMYKNGVLVYGPTSLTLSNNSGPVYIGAALDTLSENFEGYMSDVRIVKGNALYTTSFTPPTTALPVVDGTSLLLKANNGAVFDATNKNLITINGAASASSAITKFGSKTLYLTGGYLTIPHSDSVNLSGVDFTIEANVYWTDSGTNAILINKDGVQGSKYVSYGFRISSSILYFDYNGASPYAINTGYTFPKNTWKHIAVGKSGNTTTVFVDGSAVSTSTTASVGDQAGNLWIGYQGGTGTTLFRGYIDDLRITKGINRYAGLSSFTIPVTAYPTQ